MRFLFLLVLLAATGGARAEVIEGIVTVVIDGDTVLFRPDRYAEASRAFLKVRLAGIDAPEAKQPHGDAASRALRALALNRRGMLELVATDFYGRKLGRLRVDGVDVNAELVRRGHAWAYGSRPRSGSAAPRGAAPAGASLRRIEHEARVARRGLWREPAPTPPWVWRREHPQAPHR